MAESLKVASCRRDASAPPPLLEQTNDFYAACAETPATLLDSCSGQRACRDCGCIVLWSAGLTGLWVYCARVVLGVLGAPSVVYWCMCHISGLCAGFAYVDLAGEVRHLNLRHVSALEGNLCQLRATLVWLISGVLVLACTVCLFAMYFSSHHVVATVAAGTAIVV